MCFTGFISLHLNHNPIKVDVTLMISSHAEGFSLISPFGSPFLLMNSNQSERSGGLFPAHYTTRSDTPRSPASPALSHNFAVRPPSHFNANDPRFEWLPGIWLGRYQLELISSQGCDNVRTWDSFRSSCSPRARRTNNLILSLAEQMLRLKVVIILSSPAPTVYDHYWFVETPLASLQCLIDQLPDKQMAGNTLIIFIQLYPEAFIIWCISL